MEPKRERFHKVYGKKQDYHPSRTKTIYQCEDDDPPPRKTASVNELCTINYDMNTPFYSLEDFTGASGKKLKRFTHEIEMMPSGVSNEFSVFYQGNKLGSQNARIDFQHSAPRASSGHFGVSPGRDLPRLAGREVREK